VDKLYKLGTGATMTYFEKVDSLEGVDPKNRELVPIKKRRYVLVMGGVLNQLPFIIDLDRLTVDYSGISVADCLLGSIKTNFFPEGFGH
jgi:hypothetical protein